MQIFIETLKGYIITSLPIGFITGFLYDTLCALPHKLSVKKRHFFVSDFLFTIFLFLIYFILTYSKNCGSYRAYSFVIIIAVSLIYKVTFGKLVFNAEYRLAIALEKFFKYVCKKFKITIDISAKFVKIKLVHYRIKSYKRKLFKLAKKGFPRKDGYGRKNTKAIKK